MELLFSAESPEVARAIQNEWAGPDNLPGIDAVPTPDIMPSPHIEQLAGFASGRDVPLCTDGMVALTELVHPDSDEQAGPTIQQLPDTLRDLAAEVTMTDAIAAAWAAELWSHDAASAMEVGTLITELARRARSQGRHLYAWWLL